MHEVWRVVGWLEWLKAEGIRLKEKKDGVQFPYLEPCAWSPEPRYISWLFTKLELNVLRTPIY